MPNTCARRSMLLCGLLLSLCSTLRAEDLGPSRGSLVIVGGGRMGKEIVAEFLHRADGRDQAFVIIPTANEGEEWGKKYVAQSFLARAGVKDIAVLHARDRAVADSEEFVASLRRAHAVWLDGGRQWRLADAYLGTRTQREIFAVLERGGVVGGSSAGATIQGSYLVRGAPEGNQIMMAKGHEEGFGLLKNSAIDQHVLTRKRERDLAPVIAAHPQLLGLGIDEDTAVVVTGNKLRVVGSSRVLVHGQGLTLAPDTTYLTLSAGDEFDLAQRRVLKATSE